MSFDVNNPYFRNQVLTASPEKLRLLLLDGCIRFMENGREGMAAKDYEKMYDGISQARDIVMELISGMKPEVDPDLCSKLGALYTFVFKHLTEAGFEKSVDKMDECIKLMRYERDTWAQLCEQLWKQRGTQQHASSTTPNNTPAPARATGTYGPSTHQSSGGGLSFSA